MAVTTGSGGLPGMGNWVGLGKQGSGMAEAAGQAAAQPGQSAALPSSTTLVQTARTALAVAQAQQADVMLTLSEGAKSLLGTTFMGNGSTQSAALAGGVDKNTTTENAAGQAGRVAGQTVDGAGSTALVADIMRAADAVLNDPSATAEQKGMASQLVQLATAMAGQSISGVGSGTASGGGVADLLLFQSPGQQVEEPGALGGAVVTTSGLYGLASSSIQNSRQTMANALAGMGGAQAEEIVMPGGIVQLPQSMVEGADALLVASPAVAGNGLTNALNTALLPNLFKALSTVLADTNATDAQKAAATALLQMLETAENTDIIPQALLNPLLAAALMPALNPSQRGRLVRAALAGEVEDMGRTEDAAPSARPGVAGLRAAWRKNAAYLAAVQQPLLNRVFQLTRKQEADMVEEALAGWGIAGFSREQLMEDALGSASILAFSQNLMADSPFMGAMATTSLTPILIMSWAALLSGCLPRAYPFVPRVWRRAQKKRWRRKNRRQKMDFQNLLFTGAAVDV